MSGNDAASDVTREPFQSNTIAKEFYYCLISAGAPGLRSIRDPHRRQLMDQFPIGASLKQQQVVVQSHLAIGEADDFHPLHGGPTSQERPLVRRAWAHHCRTDLVPYSVACGSPRSGA